MKAADLYTLLQEGEGVMLEYKEGLSSSFARELVALANTAGGRILLGVRDDGTIKGIADTNQLRARIQDLARNCDPPVKIFVRRIRGEAHVQGCPEPLFEETGFVTATFFPNPEVRTQAGGQLAGASEQVGTMIRPMMRPMRRWNPPHEDPASPQQVPSKSQGKSQGKFAPRS
jgi:hypothetical protein